MKTATYQNQTSLLRGGRMTKYKGQAASFAPALGRVLCSVSVAAVGTALVFGGSAAWGGNCVDQGGGNFTCSGPANDITPEGTILIDEPVSPTVITTEPGFGHNATGDAIRIRDAGTVTFTDANGSQITGEKDGLDIRADDGMSITTTGHVAGGDDGIYARNINTGAMSIDVVDVTGATGHGIFANNSDGRSDNPPITDLTITASGTVQGGTNGIVASLGIFTAFYYPASGDLSINVADVVGADGYGIHAVGTGTDLSVTSTGHIQGTQHGVLAINQGRGALSVDVADVTSTEDDGIRAINESLATDLSITASGKVAGNQNGIYTNNTGTGALTIDVADVSADNGRGIQAGNYGTDLSITATGAIQAAQDGIFAQNVGTGALSIDVADVTSTSGKGIDASNGSAGSDLSITSTGHIQAAQHGILAINQGSGALNIDVANVTSTDEHGISAVNSSQGTDLSITVSGAVTVDDEGIYASNSGSGALTIDVTDVSSANGLGIQASNEGTDLSITATGAVQAAQDGINADNDGTGALTIEVVDVTSAIKDGIDATNGGTGTDLSITATGAITAELDGIDAENQGTGALSIDAADITAQNGAGIRARNNGTDLSITATGAIQAALDGISVDHTGTGAVRIDVADVTSTGDGGIFAYLDSGATGLSISASGSITAMDDGISVENLGSGETTINVVDVASTTGDGITASTSAPGTGLSIISTGAITAAQSGIKADNRGSGALTIDVNDVTSTAGGGIEATNRSNGTDLSITASGAIETTQFGVHAENEGMGALTIEVAEVTSTNGYGIEATNAGTDLSVIATGGVIGGLQGINVENQGTGALTVDATDVTGETGSGIRAVNAGTSLSIKSSGTVTGGGGDGIRATNNGSGATMIDVADVSGSANGIHANNTETGTDLAITSTGHVNGAVTGIFADSNGTGALTIDVADVTGSADYGIYASNSNAGTDLSITATGTIQSAQTGVRVGHYGSGNLTIDVADVTSATGDGIVASNSNAGTDLSITTTGTIAAAQSGIKADNRGSGALTIDVNDVAATGGKGIEAINRNGTDLTITASGTVSASDTAIQAVNDGSGTLSVAVNTVHSDEGYGIEAINDNEYDSDLLISATGHVSGFKGIFADQGNRGVLSIDVADVTATGRHGILATSIGTDVTISASGTITAFENGIDAEQRGEGALSINVADVTGGSGGVSGYGIYARGDDETTRMTITSSGHVSGTTGGITAQTDGGNSDIIIDVVDVTATGGNGIQVDHRGADLAITSSGTVTGSQSGIAAFHSGDGALTIDATNAVGTNSRGITAQSYGTDISITATGDVTGLNGGIFALNYGTGVTNVTVSGNVSSADGPAIQAASRTASTIELLDGAVVGPASGQAIINGSDDGTVILRDGSRLSGSVAMNDGNDTLIVEGGSDIRGVTLFNGGGGDDDALVFSGFTGTFDSAVFTDWESLTAQDGGSLTLDSTDAGTIEAILISTGAEIVAGNADFTFDGSLQINATGRFLAGAAGSGNVSFVQTVHNNGLITTADGVSGDRLSFGADLTGNGVIGLDVNLTDGINDAVFVAGNTAGANHGIDVITSGSTVDTAQVFTLVTVAGNNSASDFQLINTGFVTNDGVQAISDGEIAYLLEHNEAAGTFVLNPFDNGEVLLNPGGTFLAAGVEQLSQHLTFGSTLRRVMNATQGNSEGVQAVSRALHDFSTSAQPHFWVQASGKSSSYSFDDRNVDTDTGEVRIGGAVPLADIGNGRLIGGFEFGIGTLSSNVKNTFTSASIDTDARDLTLSALWVADSQFYTDVQLRYASFDSTITPNGGAAVNIEGEGYGASIEIGMPFDLRNGLTLIPQAQVSYSDIDVDDVTNLGGGGLTGSVSDGDNLTARLGLRAEKTFANGSMLFGQVDYSHAFDNTTSVVFGSNSIVTARDRGSVALTLGGHMAISQNTSLFGEITGASSLGGSSNNRSIGGSLGFQIRF